MKDERASAVHSEPYILVPHTVTDLDDFVANPDSYLVSMYDEPERAASLWRERLKRNPYGSEGYLWLNYRGRDLLTPDMWDEVTGIWYALIDLVEAFVQNGSAETFFPGQPLRLRLYRSGKSVLFSVEDQTTRADPAEFMAGLLAEAARYFSWVEEHVGIT